MAAQTKETVIKSERVFVIGSGLIGRSFAMLFASAGYHVSIYDIEKSQVQDALDNILVLLKDLEKSGLLRGTLSVEQQHQLISGCDSMAEGIPGAKYLQECVPESLELKRKVWAQIDEHASETTILASSTSSLPASTFTSELKHREQCIVAHPTNPPFYCPLVEVVPAPYTLDWVREGATEILREAGEVPVLVRKEVRGFVLNRLQYAFMNECWRLVQDDAISVEDMDKVMKDGLGLRYAFLGPLETCHLNAEGMRQYCERYGDTIYQVSKDFGPIPKWEGATADKIAREMEEVIPLDQLAERRRWRDARLAALARLKRDMENKQ